MNVQDLLNAEDAMPVIPQLTGRVKYADAVVHSKPGAERAWRFLPVKIEDTTGIIKAVIWDWPVEILPSAIVGKPITIKAEKNGKGVLVGANVKHRVKTDGASEVTLSVNLPNVTIDGRAIQESGQAPLASPAASPGAPAQGTSHGGFAGPVSDMALLRRMAFWQGELYEIVTGSGSIEASPDVIVPAIQALLSTLVISATNGRLTLEPVPSDVLRKPPATREPSGDGLDPERIPEDDDDIPF